MQIGPILATLEEPLIRFENFRGLIDDKVGKSLSCRCRTG